MDPVGPENAPGCTSLHPSADPADWDRRIPALLEHPAIRAAARTLCMSESWLRRVRRHPEFAARSKATRHCQILPLREIQGRLVSLAKPNISAAAARPVS